MKSKLFGIPLIAVAIAAITIISSAGLVFATISWPTHNITGGGTITVTGGQQTASVPDFLVSPTSINFSGSVTSGNTYSKTISVSVTNNSTAGTDGASLTIHNLTATGQSMPSGWTLSGSHTGLTLNPGGSTSLDITLESQNPLTDNVTLPVFTIVLGAS
jgi:hypothetical protein